MFVHSLYFNYQSGVYIEYMVIKKFNRLLKIYNQYIIILQFNFLSSLNEYRCEFFISYVILFVQYSCNSITVEGYNNFLIENEMQFLG